MSEESEGGGEDEGHGAVDEVIGMEADGVGALEGVLRGVAGEFLARARQHVASPRECAILFARAAREALDMLLPEERGEGFLVRTWPLPEISSAARVALAEILEAWLVGRRIDSDSVDRVALASVLSHATQLAFEDLSSDDQLQMEGEILRIVGTSPEDDPGVGEVGETGEVEEECARESEDFYGS